MAASYGAPGVYVEEKPSGSMPVQGVGTAVAAFVGFTELYRPDAGDPTDPDGVKPQLVTSWPQYERVYGGFAPGIKLPHAVKGFFENGGGICYIVRIPTEGGNGRLPQRALPAAGRHEIETLVVESRHADARLDVVIEGAPPVEGQEQASPEFTLKVVQDGAVKEEYGGLTIGRGQRGVDRVVNERSKLIQVQVQTVTGLSLADRVPAPGRYSIVPAAPATISARPEAFEGSETARTGYQGLAIADDVTMVAIPDLVTVATNEDGSFDYEMYLAAQGKLVDWCEASRTRMAILDAPPGLNAQGALDWRNALGKDSAFGAAYYPHLVVANPAPRAGELHPVLRRQRHPDLGRPHLGQHRPELAVHQRPAPVHLHRGVDPPRHAVGRLRAERLGPVGPGPPHGVLVPDRAVDAGRAGRRDTGTGFLHPLRRDEQPNVLSGRRQARGRRRHRAGQARGVRHLPDQPVAGRREHRRVNGDRRTCQI